MLGSLTGIVCKLLGGGAADRMPDNGEFVVRHAQRPAHDFGCADEPLRHHRDGWHSLPLSCNGVVQTAR